MNFKNKMTEIRRRHLAGVTRFISASVLALLFFWVILGRVLYAVLFDKEVELFSQSVEQVLIAVMTTLFFSVVWRIVGERRGQVGFLYEIVNVPVLGGFYFLWKSMPMNMYYTMYVAGVLLALFCYGVFALDGRDEGYFLGSFCVVLENGGTDFSYRCIGKHLPFCH